MTRFRKSDPDVLLASALRILSSSEPTTFEVKPWREIMPAANAKEKQTALKAAVKAAKAKGITPPKHKPGESAPGVKGQFPENPLKVGVDNQGHLMVHSVVDYQPDTTKGTTMKTDKTAPEAKPDDEATKKAKADAAAAKKAEADKVKAEKKAEREAKAAKNKAEREAAIAAKKAAATEAGSKRTYFGPMLNLSDKVKAGAYKKGLNGQLRSDDDVAQVLEACSAKNVVTLLRQVLTPIWPEAANAYAHLNIGQQSMNLRNKLRGFLKADEPKITIESVKAARDAGNFADAEEAIAAKAARKAQREADAKAKAEAKAQKPAAPANQATAPAAAA